MRREVSHHLGALVHALRRVSFYQKRTKSFALCLGLEEGGSVRENIKRKKEKKKKKENENETEEEEEEEEEEEKGNKRKEKRKKKTLKFQKKG